MTVVAEGIETQPVWDLLVDIGCDRAQGYLMGKPMPGEELKGWLDQWN